MIDLSFLLIVRWCRITHFNIWLGLEWFLSKLLQNQCNMKEQVKPCLENSIILHPQHIFCTCLSSLIIINKLHLWTTKHARSDMGKDTRPCVNRSSFFHKWMSARSTPMNLSQSHANWFSVSGFMTAPPDITPYLKLSLVLSRRCCHRSQEQVPICL